MQKPGSPTYHCEVDQYSVPLTAIDELPGQELLKASDPLTRRIMIAGLSAVAFAGQQDLSLNTDLILGDGDESIHDNHREWFKNGRGLGQGYLAAAGACIVALAQATSDILRSPYPTQIDSAPEGDKSGSLYSVRHIILPVEDPHMQELVDIQLSAFHPVESLQIGMSTTTKGSEVIQFATVSAGEPSVFGPRSNYLTVFTERDEPNNRVEVRLEAGTNMGAFGTHTGVSFPRIASYARFMKQYAAGGEAGVREAADRLRRSSPLRTLFARALSGDPSSIQAIKP